MLRLDNRTHDVRLLCVKVAQLFEKHAAIETNSNEYEVITGKMSESHLHGLLLFSVCVSF